MYKYILYLLATFCAYPAVCQTEKEILTLNNYYELIRDLHPMARQAKLIIQRGDMEIRESRGAFDPKLVSTYDTKQFQGKNYYEVWDSYVKIPTILNVDLKAGYERNNGQFLNPENNVPAGGLYYAGVSVPLGQGLIHNSRTIGLKKGRVEQRSMQNQAYAVYNNLMLDANHVYWQWYESYQKLNVAQSNLALMTERFLGIREGALNGENATIDSVEALIQVQSWINNTEKARIDFQNMNLQMNTMIWDTEIQPDQRLPDTVNQVQPIFSLDEYLDFALRNHPDLNSLEASLNGLELDRRLAAENLKPTINLNYNFITGGETTDESMTGATNNYKGGVEFSFPLFIRKERAKLKQTKIKIEEGDLKLDQKSREITNKVIQSYGKMQVLAKMIIQQREIIRNYETLLQGEKTKFDNGESSIFLINSRENKKIEAELKLVELEAEYGRSIGLTDWSSSYFIDDILRPIP